MKAIMKKRVYFVAFAYIGEHAWIGHTGRAAFRGSRCRRGLFGPPGLWCCATNLCTACLCTAYICTAVACTT